MSNDKKHLLGKTNQRLVKQLFIEWAAIGEYDNAVYSTKREDTTIDGTLYPSLYLLYMETADITENAFVELYMYDWTQWEKVSSAPFFKDEVARWRKDLKARKMAELVGVLMEDALSSSRSSKSSAKYLVDKLSKTKGAGKPSTAVVPSSEQELDELTKSIYVDKERLGLVN